MQIPLLWGPLWGHPPLNAQAAGINVPQCWAASGWIRPFFSEMPNLALPGDSDVWERGGSSAALDRAALQLPSGTGELWHCQSPPPRDPGHPAQWDPAPQPWMPQGRIWQRGSPLG